MNLLASKAQLRASLLRWALFLVPLTVLLGFLAGRLGGSPNSAWFVGLAKPEIYPEPYVFGLVWTVLYIMIGFSAALVASAWGAFGRGLAMGLFAFHFILNLAWTPVFFGMQNILGGLAVIALVDITLIAVVWAFWRVRRSAGMLLLPYLAWVLFASVLNYQFHVENPDGGHGGPPAERIEL